MDNNSTRRGRREENPKTVPGGTVPMLGSSSRIFNVSIFDTDVLVESSPSAGWRRVYQIMRVTEVGHE